MIRDHFRILTVDLATGKGKVVTMDGRDTEAGGSDWFEFNAIETVFGQSKCVLGLDRRPSITIAAEQLPRRWYAALASPRVIEPVDLGLRNPPPLREVELDPFRGSLFGPPVEVGDRGVDGTLRLQLVVDRLGVASPGGRDLAA